MTRCDGCGACFRRRVRPRRSESGRRRVVDHHPEGQRSWKPARRPKRTRREASSRARARARRPASTSCSPSPPLRPGREMCAVPVWCVLVVPVIPGVALVFGRCFVPDLACSVGLPEPLSPRRGRVGVEIWSRVVCVRPVCLKAVVASSTELVSGVVLCVCLGLWSGSVGRHSRAFAVRVRSLHVVPQRSPGLALYAKSLDLLTD